MNPKQVAAQRAVTYISDGMNVGLGTGSTAALAIAELGRRVREEGIAVRCIATSLASHKLACDSGIPMLDWDALRRFDITIDGADEVDPAFRLIKGGGGALVREKIVAAASDAEIIVVDPSKVVESLGAFPLPVAVLPFGWQATLDRLERNFACPVTLRKNADDVAILTDDSLHILDMRFGAPLPDLEGLEAHLKTIVGVVEVGLFTGLCQRLIIGNPDGSVRELTPA